MKAIGYKMGKILSKVFGNKEMRILMLGLDAAGKTTILYKLKLNQHVNTIPTVGFNMRKITKGRVTIKLWDIGGQPRWCCAPKLNNVPKVIDLKVQISVNVGTVLQRCQCHSLHGG